MAHHFKKSDFNYHLPPELIAQYPTKQRTDSRLLCLYGHNAIQHNYFRDLPSLLNSNDLLVFNNTRVVPARLFGHKKTGGKIEVLVERILDNHCVFAHIRSSKSPRVGCELLLENAITAKVNGRHEDLFELEFLASNSVIEILENSGHMPLPPYINRSDEHADKERYQTVYGIHKGAVAAPTAGLHFDHHLLEQIKSVGVQSTFVTLHVGAGTFQPMRVENIAEHVMHSEYAEISEQTVALIHQTKERGGRVIAVGTTSTRVLESAALSGDLKSFQGDTKLFITPGFEFRCVDAMITNFHLPESTLMMLVCAFAGYEEMMTAYRVAIEQRYRFYSYGDAMFVMRKEQL